MICVVQYCPSVACRGVRGTGSTSLGFRFSAAVARVPLCRCAAPARRGSAPPRAPRLTVTRRQPGTGTRQPHGGFSYTEGNTNTR